MTCCARTYDGLRSRGDTSDIVSVDVVVKGANPLPDARRWWLRGISEMVLEGVVGVKGDVKCVVETESRERYRSVPAECLGIGDRSLGSLFKVDDDEDAIEMLSSSSSSSAASLSSTSDGTSLLCETSSTPSAATAAVLSLSISASKPAWATSSVTLANVSVAWAVLASQSPLPDRNARREASRNGNV